MHRTFGVVCFLAAAAASAAAAQDPSKYFQDNCAPCHAIGAPGAAPDLKGVTARRQHAWLVHFILDPEQTARTDPSAAALVKQYDGVMMPAPDGINPGLAEALLQYIDAASGATPAKPGGDALARPRAVTAADVEAGRDLYDGRRALARGGPPCVSCHRLDAIGGTDGGRLGPDLTLATKRLGGTPGLSGWMRDPPTRVMRALFRDRPLADEEMITIVAFLDLREHAGAAGNRLAAASVPAAGAAAAIVLLALMGLVWSHRLRAVRRPLVESARSGMGTVR